MFFQFSLRRNSINMHLINFFHAKQDKKCEDHVWFKDRWMVASWCDE
jgi:hypothetical protein